MNSVNRRSALGLAATALAMSPMVSIAQDAARQRHKADAGEEIAPGVRRIQLSKRKSEIAAYPTVAMIDVVFQPKSSFSNPTMASDMVCHCLEGELAIDQGGSMQFVAKTDDVWSCRKGMPEKTENRGATTAIMRIIMLTA